MALQAPLVYDTALGHARRIAAGDTLDSVYLSSSGSVPVTVTANYSLSANSQVFARKMKIDASHDVLIPADSELVFA